MPQLKKSIIDDNFGAVDDEDFGAIDDTDFGAVDDVSEVQTSTVNPLEVDMRIEADQKAAVAVAQAHAKAKKDDPGNWSLDKTKKMLKENPPQTLEEEAAARYFVNGKEQRQQAIQDNLEIDEIKKNVIPGWQRPIRQFAAGAVSTVEGVGGGLQWLGIKNLGKNVERWGRVAREFYQVPDPTFVDQVASGFGSLGTFMIPGVGIAKGAQALSFAPRLAAWLGVSASSALESMVEAGSSYNRAKEKGFDEKGASAAATFDFWMNLPTVVFTNKLGVFGENGKAAFRILAASGMEGAQEFTQTLYGNIATSDPEFAGALESFGVGAITGGGVKAVMTGAEKIAQGVKEQPADIEKVEPSRKGGEIVLDETGKPLTIKAGEEVIPGDLATHGGRTVSVQRIEGDVAEIVHNQIVEKVPVADVLKVPRTEESIVNLPEVKAARERAAAIPVTVYNTAPERLALRKSIAEEAYKSGQETRMRNRRADLVLGGPSSGKSQVVDPLVAEHKALKIDNDDYKLSLPEYEKGIGAEAVHLESADIERDVIAQAEVNGDNIVVARLGKNPKTIEALISTLNKAGYDVHLHLVELPVEKAMQRTVNRFIERGRFVDPLYVKKVGLTPKETYDMLKVGKGVKSYESVTTDVKKGELPRRTELSSGVIGAEHGLRGGVVAPGSPAGIITPPGQEVGAAREEPAVKPAVEVPITPSIEEFSSVIEQGYDEMSDAEKAAYELEIDNFRKTPEGNLFKAIKALGGIKPFKGGFLKEEMAEVPFYLKNRDAKNTLDELVDELKQYGWNFADGEELRAEIVRQRDNPAPKVDRVSLKKIIKEAEKNKKLQETMTAALEGKRRKFIQTVKSSEKTLPEVAQKIESRYEPISNKETLAQAQEFVKEDYNQAVEMTMGTTRPTAFSNAVAIVLIDQAQAQGRVADAINLVERTAEKQTALGQAIQALSMYNRLTPEGILQYAQKVVRQAKEQAPREKVTQFEKMRKTLNEKDTAKLADKLGVPHISETVAAELRKMAEQLQDMPEGRDKQIRTALMLDKISQLVPKSLGQKLSLIQTMAQLLNPKTFVRNLLGNIGFQITEGLSDTVGAALDIATSLRTGKRTIYLPDIKLQAAGLAQGFKEGTEEAFLGVNLKEETTKFTLPKSGVFDKGVMGALEKTLRIALGATDRAFYQAAFNQSIRDQMLTAKQQGVEVKEPTEDMIERAHFLGLYRTFQDDNVLSRQFVGLKKWFNAGGEFGLGDVVLKYPKTPANIMARGIEYSPFGFVKTVYEMVKPLVGKEFNQEQFVRATSRALVGSAGLVGTGAMLAAMGIISGKRTKDKDVAATREAVGIREYQINVDALKRFAMSGFDPEAARIREDDLLVTYDWFLPNSIGLALGANMVLDPKSNLVDRTLNLGDKMLQASETLQEQPLVRGVKALTQKQNIAEGLSDVVQDIPASFVPTLLNQIRQLTDNTSRNTKDLNWFKEVYNKTIMRVPVAASTLPPKITPLGEEKQMYQFDSNNPFNVFLNPAFVSRYKPDPVSKMVLDIWEMSGETVQFPRMAAGKIKLGPDTPEPLELTAEQYTEFQRYIGNKTDVLFSILSDDPDTLVRSGGEMRPFGSLENDEKAKVLQGLLTDINTAAKIEVLGYQPKKVSKDVMEIIEQIGQDKREMDAAEDEDLGAIDE